MKRFPLCFVALCALLCPTATAVDAPLFAPPPEGVNSLWASFENPGMAKGAGAMSNRGGKGAAFRRVAAGETVTLLEASGPGTLRRMWMTLATRTPEALRAYVLRMYWDGAETPAVEAPLGDFFCAVLGRMQPMENDYFSSPEGRSFVCALPMPFRAGAKVTFTNESGGDLPQLFYDINCTLGDAHPEGTLYFHTVWRRENRTQLGRDFEILPKVAGRGRFLGAHIGVVGNPSYSGWFGEGEVKMYVDGDAEWPTIAGTGTEDYIGTAYGQGAFVGRQSGCLVSDDQRRVWTFYRYHGPDPVYFHRDLRVTLQQMGGADKVQVMKMIEQGAELRPVTIEGMPLLEGEAPKGLDDPSLPAAGWTNFFRRDDVCAAALFYLDRPENGLPRLAPAAERTAALPPLK